MVVKGSKVTIVIPTYNAGKYIYETVDSCLKQTYSNIEIVVIDDNSMDNTLSILNEFSEEIRIIANKQNQGLPKNINSVILSSDSEFFIYLGHDDLLPKDHVALILNEFDTGTAAIHCNSMAIGPNGNKIGLTRDDQIQQKKNANIMYELSLNNFLSVIGMMHRTSSFKKIGGWDTTYDLYGEWLYYTRLLSVGKIKYSTSSTAFYRVHETNITKSLHNKDKLKAYYEYKKRCRILAKANCKMTVFGSVKYLKVSIMNYLRYLKCLLTK
ncbi:MAG: alpha-1,3-rhamnosyltransferase [Alteromonadaceae bacterium]|jgi:alpha-1,3-rhamnosyltransferase